MKGTFPKYIAPAHLQCKQCTQFRDDDPDVFYCESNHEEFPGLCNEYQPRNLKQWATEKQWTEK